MSKVSEEVRHFLRNKKQEWEEYRSEVTAFELCKTIRCWQHHIQNPSSTAI
ncbi:hypothetical protein GCM10023329_10630 [Streptomyces sanyensis]|uniref:Transposase n=1 Tax=Streptomyces sanyensis TaxID=568869 RepID=A0ABP8ZU95_9ACTN